MPLLLVLLLLPAPPVLLLAKRAADDAAPACACCCCAAAAAPRAAALPSRRSMLFAGSELPGGWSAFCGGCAGLEGRGLVGREWVGEVEERRVSVSQSGAAAMVGCC